MFNVNNNVVLWNEIPLYLLVYKWHSELHRICGWLQLRGNMLLFHSLVQRSISVIFIKLIIQLFAISTVYIIKLVVTTEGNAHAVDNGNLLRSPLNSLVSSFRRSANIPAHRSGVSARTSRTVPQSWWTWCSFLL